MCKKIKNKGKILEKSYILYLRLKFLRIKNIEWLSDKFLNIIVRINKVPTG